jgi:amidase
MGINMKIGDSKTVNREMYLDTALSIQVVTPKLQERRLLQAMALIDGVVSRDKGPASPRETRL